MKDNTVGTLLGLFYIAVWVFVVVGVYFYAQTY